MQFIAHNYQEQALKHILHHKYCALFLDMGLGKTIITLSAIKLLLEQKEIRRVLIIAPKRVAEDSWHKEAAKWSHTCNLTFSHVLGSAKERIKALNAQTDIYITNRENTAWIINYYGNSIPFNMLVIDELSSFKSAKSQRFKALKKSRKCFERVVGLTGTPTPNGLDDLWSQMYLIDEGERLEPRLSTYYAKYFRPNRTNGFLVYDYKPLKGAKENIYKKISDIALAMQKEDYLQLPPVIYKEKLVKLGSKSAKEYTNFEKSLVLNTEITAINAAALTNKLQQLANGAIYDDKGNVHIMHTAKLEALSEIIESSGASNILLYYHYKHDLQELDKHFQGVKLSGPEEVNAWNKGNIKLMLCHASSSAHGLNLQTGGNIIVWYSMPWSLELYQQGNGRLHRQGQERPVLIHHIIAKDTIDELIMAQLQLKNMNQQELLISLKQKHMKI